MTKDVLNLLSRGVLSDMVIELSGHLEFYIELNHELKNQMSKDAQDRIDKANQIRDMKFHITNLEGRIEQKDISINNLKAINLGIDDVIQDIDHEGSTFIRTREEMIIELVELNNSFYDLINKMEGGSDEI